ncbi:hypothetical protein OEZ85_014304 [Tetradesmus obliquus]|uniref:TOG domain-containing protein n=1 Tax=Tetradesmus obliquus TaxID=3088 RepID=A0ABY8U7W3_TETOB|nr:hypothetical protein OEZ85_014304 [Tetradesmus obliquus]
MEQQEQQLKFGFLPAQALQEINELGQWKTRSAALQQVQQGLASLADKSMLLQQLPEFMEFLVQLLQDHNFKMATAGLEMLAGLASGFGTLLQPHLSLLAPIAQLSYPASKLDMLAAAQLLLDALVPSPFLKHQALALEGLALATDALGPELPPLLRQAAHAQLIHAHGGSMSAGGVPPQQQGLPAAVCRSSSVPGRHDLSFLTASQQLQLGGLAGLDSSVSCGSASPLIGSPLASMRASAVGLDMAGGSSGGRLETLSPSRGERLAQLKRRQNEKRGSSASGGSRGSPFAELAPLPDPEGTLRQVIAKCQQSNTAARKELDWQGQLDALTDARRLTAHHAEVVMAASHELVLAVLPAVEELRSTTARVALQLLQELPAVLGRSLERELEDIVPVLLKKAGELSTAGRDNFLAAEADKALSAILAAASEARALSALLASGVSHKSPHVRCRAAAHLDEVAAAGQGLEALLRGNNWSLLDRVFKAAAVFLQEGSLDTRTYGKRLLWAVKAALHGSRSDLDRLVTGVTPDASQRRVVEVLDGLTAAPPPPSRGSGAPGSSGRGNGSFNGSGSGRNISWQAAAAAAVPRDTAGPMGPELQEAVDQVGLHLASKDWRNRSDALAALSALLPALPEVPNGPLEELLGSLVARLADSNAKVNVQALQVVADVLPVVRARCLLVLPSLLQALAANLGSSNDRVRAAAAAALDALAAVVEPPLLLGGLGGVIGSSSIRGKQALLERLSSLAPQVYRYQPQLVVKQVLPAAFAIALEAKGDLRPATAQLLGVLAQLMGGSALLAQAAGVSAAVESRVRDFLPMGGARGSMYS